MNETLDKPIHLPERRTITRRTALRGAAWTAPAITIAVAAPNFAAHSHETPPSVRTQPGTAFRTKDDANIQQVIWDFTIENTGATAIAGLAAVFSGVDGVFAVRATSVSSTTGSAAVSVPTTWSGNGVSTRTYGTLAAGERVNLHVVFDRSNNGTGTAVANLMAGGISLGTVSAAYP